MHELVIFDSKFQCLSTGLKVRLTISLFSKNVCFVLFPVRPISDIFINFSCAPSHFKTTHHQCQHLSNTMMGSLSFRFFLFLYYILAHDAYFDINTFGIPIPVIFS